MTVKVSKVLNFTVVALPGVEYMFAQGEDEKGAARGNCAAAMRATQSLVTTVNGDGRFGGRLTP